MRKIKVGDRIVLEVEEKDVDQKRPCKGCFFFDAPLGAMCLQMCRLEDRKSGTVKYVIFKQVNK